VTSRPRGWPYVAGQAWEEILSLATGIVQQADVAADRLDDGNRAGVLLALERIGRKAQEQRAKLLECPPEAKEETA
jgi:hypothetical protein